MQFNCYCGTFTYMHFELPMPSAHNQFVCCIPKAFLFFPFYLFIIMIILLIIFRSFTETFFFNNLILTVRIAYVIDRLYTLGIERLLIKFGWKMTDFKPILNVFDKTHCFYANSKMIKWHFHLYRAFTLRGDPKE